MTGPRLSGVLAILTAAALAAAPAAAHPPGECRTALADFAARAKAFEESRAVTGPVLAELLAAWDKVERADSHADRHALIYRHFVAEFPRLKSPLSAQIESSADAIRSARKAIFCLSRQRTPP